MTSAGWSDAKEHQFFNARWGRYRLGLSHYAASFPRCGTNVLTVDGTPDYINEAQALRNLAKSYGPQRLAKTTFAVLLCDPVQRAFSAVNHFKLGSFRCAPLIEALSPKPQLPLSDRPAYSLAVL
jgi:hypothetical protein